MPADCSSTPQTKRADARGCAGITGSANVRLDFGARRSYFKGMKLFLAVLKQRRAIPREGSAVSSAPVLRPPTGVSRGGRPCGHLSGHPSGRLALRPEGWLLATLRRLRALNFADISTSQSGRCMSRVRRRPLRESMWLLAPLAPGAIAIASALAPQRISAEPRRRRPAAALCGAVGVPLLACLAMARWGDEGCPEPRRGRGRARSARVMAIHRKEADLDRFVAALLALAGEPDGRGERRPGQPRIRTGESSRVEQSCRR